MTHRITLWREDLLMLLAILLLTMLAGCDLEGAEVTAAHVAEADERKAVPPHIDFELRHARLVRGCEGQPYIYQCCHHSVDAGEVACVIEADLRRKQ
jgi:hypothetical protein